MKDQRWSAGWLLLTPTVKENQIRTIHKSVGGHVPHFMSHSGNVRKFAKKRRQFGDRNFQPLPLKISDIPCLPLKRSHFLKIVIVMVITANDETARYGKSSLARSFPFAVLNSNIPFNIIDKDKLTIKWKSTSCDLQNWMTS